MTDERGGLTDEECDALEDGVSEICACGYWCPHRRNATARAAYALGQHRRDELWCRALVGLGDTNQTQRVTAAFNRLRDAGVEKEGE